MIPSPALDSIAGTGQVLAAVWLFWNLSGWTRDTLTLCAIGVHQQKEREAAERTAAATGQEPEAEPVSTPDPDPSAGPLVGHWKTPSGDGQQGPSQRPGEGRKKGGE